MTSSSRKIVKLTVPGGVDPIRLDRYLAAQIELGLSRNKIQWLIDQGDITVNGSPQNASYSVAAEDRISVTLPEPTPTDVLPQNIPLEILFEDEVLAVINKPAGMVTHPAAGVHEGTLANALVYHFEQLRKVKGHNRPGIVHRLDKGTSGLLLVAKDEKTLQLLQQSMEKREIHREYLALVCGHMPEEKGTIDLPIGRSPNERTKMAVGGTGGRESVTHYELADRYRLYDLLKVRLETGRTHQIRVHLTYLHHPVFADPEYGGREKWHKGIFAPERLLGKRLLKLIDHQALHARKLTFVHPVTIKTITCEAPAPPDFQAVLDLLNQSGR